MKYCQKCGGEINDEAVVCVHCGCSVVPEKEESKALGILSIVFGALGGWLGLILSIIGLCIYKLPENRRNCKIGLGLFFAWVVFWIVIVAIYGKVSFSLHF